MLLNQLKTKYLLILLMFFISTNSIFPQLKGMSKSFDNEDIIKQTQSPDVNFNSLLEQDKMPIGNKVDPKFYYIGPGDLLSIQIIPILPYEFPLMVSPDMTIMLPRGGELIVRDMTLEKLKDTLDLIYKQRNPIATVSLSLKKARICIVTITGDVLFPGTYSLPSSYRVSTAIKFANQASTEKAISEEEKLSIQKMQGTHRERSKNFSESGVAMQNFYANRNIILLRKDATAQGVDFEKANITGDLSTDPFIQEGDEIIVPFEPFQYPKISVSGAVKRPAVLPFKQGDMLSDLVRFGFGTTENVDFNNVKLIQPGRTPINIRVDEEMGLLGMDFELQPGAALIFGRKPEIEYENISVVSLQGQIVAPGIYPILQGKTRLKEVIETAGGFTNRAYLPLAYIIRRQEQTEAFIDYRRDYFSTFQYSDLTLEDTSRFTIDMMLKKPIVSCDFVKAFFEDSEIDNVILRDGDVIIVPDNPGYVYVYGQVNHPGYVEYRAGQNMNWYIEKAGGYAQGAAKKRSRIIRGKSRVWTQGDDKTEVLAGDEVYVPRPPDVPQTLEWQKYATIAGLLSTAAVVVNILYSIYNTERNR